MTNDSDNRTWLISGLNSKHLIWHISWYYLWKCDIFILIFVNSQHEHKFSGKYLCYIFFKINFTPDCKLQLTQFNFSIKIPVCQVVKLIIVCIFLQLLLIYFTTEKERQQGCSWRWEVWVGEETGQTLCSSQGYWWSWTTKDCWDPREVWSSGGPDCLLLHVCWRKSCSNFQVLQGIITFYNHKSVTGNYF